MKPPKFETLEEWAEGAPVPEPGGRYVSFRLHQPVREGFRAEGWDYHPFSHETPVEQAIAACEASDRVVWEVRRYHSKLEVETRGLVRVERKS